MSLLVKTYLKESILPNAGLGCFTKEFIPKGTKIWELNPKFDRIYSSQQFNESSLMEQEFIRIYSYLHRGMYILCVDNGRFINHSIDRYNTYDPIDEFASFASKDIYPGHEILSNYLTFGITPEDLNFNSII